MNRTTVFRFFTVKRKKKSSPSFGDALFCVGDRDPRSKREAQLGQDFYLRLETLTVDEADSQCLCGQINRIQKSNLPSEILADTEQALSVDNPLGHSIVFRFDRKSNILGIQNSQLIASPGRFIQYLNQEVPGATFYIEPIVKDDAWKRFSSGNIRKLSIKVSSIENLNSLESSGEAVIAALAKMGKAYISPQINIELSMGHRSGQLSESVKSLAKALLDKFTKGDIEMRALTATSADKTENDGNIDLLQDLLSYTVDIDYHHKDPNTNYLLRMNELKKIMANINA